MGWEVLEAMEAGEAGTENRVTYGRLARTPAADRRQDKEIWSPCCPGSPASFQILNNVSGSLRPGLRTALVIGCCS